MPPRVYITTTANFAVKSRTVLSSVSGSHDWIGRPALIELDSGVWVLFYRSATAHGVADGEIHIKFSGDEGRHWSDEDTTIGGVAVTGFPVTAQGAVNDTGGPTAIQAANGDLILFTYDTDTPFVRSGTQQYRSANNGATWAYEFKVTGSDEYIGASMILVDSTLYALLWRDVGTIDPPYSVEIWQSSDNAATWTLLSEVIGDSVGVNESGLVHIGGNKLMVIARSDDEDKTYRSSSGSLGVAWGAAIDVTADLGVVQKPVLKYFGDRLYLVGRDRASENSARTGLWFSDDDGKDGTWVGPFHPNPLPFTDTGYVDILQRDNGDIYLVTYEGSDPATSLIEYVLAVIQ